MKRIISVILCIAALMCLCVSFCADSVYRYGDWTLGVVSGSDDYAFSIRSYDGDDAVVTVPNDYGGYPIIDIEVYSFATNANIQEVILSDQITSIGEGAFAQCENLSKIAIPDSVTQIADNAFQGCTQVIIYAPADSYAITYAQEHEIEYVCLSIETYVRGDADDDGEVTVVDVTAIQRNLAEIPVPSFSMIASDVDGDGLDITDATKIQRYLAEFDDPYYIGEIVSGKIPST